VVELTNLLRENLTLTDSDGKSIAFDKQKPSIRNRFWQLLAVERDRSWQ